jgi:hypothetical protein
MNLRLSMWHGRRPFYFSVADLGFLGCFVSFAIYAFANVQVSAHMIGYVSGGVLFIALIRFVYMEFEAWIAGLAFAGLLLLITGRYILFTLVHPEWFFDFLASLSIVVSLALIVIGSCMSLKESRRLTVREEAPWAAKRLLGAACTALVLATFASAAATLDGVRSVSFADAAGATVIEVRAGEFLELESLLASGQNRVLLRNSDLVAHNFTLYRHETEEWFGPTGARFVDVHRRPAGLDVSLGPGSEALVSIELMAGTSYELVCRVPGHSERDGLSARE